MPHTESSLYSIMTMQEWLRKYNNDLVDLVRALCDIFALPDQRAVYTFLTKDIDQRDRILLFGEPDPEFVEPKIVAIAGWRWSDEVDHVAAFVGVRRDSCDEYLRETVIAEVKMRLAEERIMTRRVKVKYLLIQYSPYDRLMAPVCLSLNGQRHRERNSFFKNHFGTRWTLRSMMFPFKTGPVQA